MRHLLLLPLLALAACGSASLDTGEGAAHPAREYATQLEAPEPDYGALIRAERRMDFADLNREASGPPPANAKAVGQAWLSRLEPLGLVEGYGLSGKDEDSPIESFSLLMTPADFDALVAENGWQVPPHLRWSFTAPLIRPRVSEAAADGIRIWPASEARTGLQLEAAEGGRIFLRDGCFYVAKPGGGEPKLAWFHTETGLDVDEEGFYILVNRATGAVMGRLGEDYTWAAPNPITPGGPSMEKFRAACGDGEIATVANPTANARISSIYPRPVPNPPPPPGA